MKVGLLGSPKGWSDFGSSITSGASNLAGSARDSTSGGLSSLGNALFGGSPAKPSLGPAAMSPGVVQTIKNNTTHTDIQRAEVFIRVQTLPGATASVTSSDLPSNAKVSGG